MLMTAAWFKAAEVSSWKIGEEARDGRQGQAQLRLKYAGSRIWYRTGSIATVSGASGIVTGV